MARRNINTNTGFKIEKGIPAPTQQARGRGRDPKYPWHELKRSESFFVSGSVKLNIYNAVRRVNKTHAPKKFVTKYIGEERGFRVWRIK